MSIVLSFDIGIHNLAFCCLQQTTTCFKILAWDNVSLLTDSSNVGESITKPKCFYCKMLPKYQAKDKQVCGKHCPSILPPIKDLSGNPYKTLPSVGILKSLLVNKRGQPTKKDKILEELAENYSLPIIKQKKQKAGQVSMTLIHDAIRLLVEKHKALWSQCTLICLENQPAFKNPHMKSVQILLFATLRDILRPSPPQIQFVHASKKVKGMAKGDEGYKDRKQGSEDRASLFLNLALLQKDSWTEFYKLAKKKNDLADALCMSIDHSFDPSKATV